eukprot:scaffold33572_cov47-Phaeocystis_antarctica.AAC.3
MVLSLRRGAGHPPIATFIGHPHQRHDANPGAPHEPQSPPRPRHACLRHACLRHACLRHACLRDACHASIVSSHVVSARVKRAGPLTPRRRRLACLPARFSATPRSRATPRACHPAPPCDPVRLCTYAFSAAQ